MRAAYLFGILIIAYAINTKSIMDADWRLFGYGLLIAFVFDIVELIVDFIKK